MQLNTEIKKIFLLNTKKKTEFKEQLFALFVDADFQTIFDVSINIEIHVKKINHGN